MSGDVQPRKRKEKRRKREDEDSGTPPPQLVNPAEHAMDNVTIHVYKEGSTGGHWCAKIIFFALFSVLIGLVGVIILEHRGTTDVDTPISSSKWAMIFDGWVDDILPSHDNEPHEEESSKEVEHEDEDDHDKESHEEDHDDEDDDEGIGSEEEENEEDEEDDDEVNESEAVDIEDDDKEENSEDIEDDEENSEDIEDDEEENSEDIQDDEEEEEEEEDEEEDDNEVDVSKVENDEDEGFEDDDNESYENLDETDELDENESADKEDDDDNDENEEEDDNNEEDEDDITNISAPDIDVSVEGVHAPAKEDEEIDYEFMGMPGINEKDNFEKMEIVEGIEVPKEENDDVLDETSVPVKFGVGVALVIAAHIVLVRRWKNAAEETIELKRRNTIIPPTIPKKLIVTGDSNKKQQQAKIYQDLKSKYTNLQEDIKRVNKPLSSVENLRDVEKNFSKTKNEPQEIYTSESERFSGTEVESDYLDDDLEAEEDLEDEEELDDEEDIEAEEVDDSELVAKLEAKYGKLPTPSQSEEEEEDEEEEEEEEDEEEIEDEEEEEDDEGDWKRVNAPKVAHSSGEEKQSKEKESTRGRQVNPPPRGGRQAFESIHPGDYDNVNIQDEIEHWLARDLDN
ncbi:uncharacterized protein LOC103568298 isoform X3 [Microplitis demolitor]|uniref:uncharacterized protein LOC103568298 isoform X3 n=1 Tax=Microplitis demolitor TaxID=69319 RepID=UPI00235B5F3C|nr:uncharacterized protein LOC103568298 isoform X3 [Microplitis demolitor]